MPPLVLGSPPSFQLRLCKPEAREPIHSASRDCGGNCCPASPRHAPSSVSVFACCVHRYTYIRAYIRGYMHGIVLHANAKGRIDRRTISSNVPIDRNQGEMMSRGVVHRFLNSPKTLTDIAKSFYDSRVK